MPFFKTGPAVDRVSGKSGYIQVMENDQAIPVRLPFFFWTARTTIQFADRTSSVHYSQDAKLVFASSIPTAMSMSGVVRGRYRRSATPKHVIQQLFKGRTPFRMELGFSPNDKYVDLYAWITEFEIQVGLDDVVEFSCSFRSEGEITDLTNQDESEAPENPDDPGDPEADPEDDLGS
jgi:hypothetical protein